MLSGYFDAGALPDLLRLYKLARSENHRPDSFSLAFGLRSCVLLSLLRFGQSLHAEAIRLGLELDEFVSVPLINMYIELGTLEDAEKVFDRVPLPNSSVWSLMMKGYLKASLDMLIFDLFNRMKASRVGLDPCSAVCLARVCGNVGAVKDGRAIHALCLKRNFVQGNIYLQTSLIDMYCRAGTIDFARRLFGEMPEKDVVSWTSMVAGLARCGRPCESLGLFQYMLEESVLPNEVTLASVLLACSQLGTLHQGKSVHGYIIRNGIKVDVVSDTSLLDMYAKCGSVEIGYRVFLKMPERNVYTWSVVIGGFGMHGLWSKAIELFDCMQSENIIPNSVTFVALLSACSHSGKVQEGHHYFKSMVQDFQLSPKDEHYSCMVDLLGRAGLIDEAESLIKEMPFQPSASVWGALLGACRIHKRVELAVQVVKKLSSLEANEPGVHVLLSNIYAGAEMWGMVKNTRDMYGSKQLKKTAGYSTIEVDKRVYIFNAIAGRDSQDIAIVDFWCKLRDQMKALGYVPDLSFILHDVDDETKEEMLCCHSEKLAIAFGLLKTKDGSPLRIVKNLRVCGDCHTASKFVSIITKREIVMRDSKRFHHVKDGVCSCGDYW